MKYTYKLTKLNSVILRNDNTYIPMSEANTDYQEFVQWCEQGNTPLPADSIASTQDEVNNAV
jgi:hypothetical protein